MPEQRPSATFLNSIGETIKGMPNEIRPGVTAVIFNDNGDVLLEKREDNGFWGLLGGAVDIGESITEAVIREVMEETALNVRVMRLIGIYSNPHEYNISVYPDGNVVQWVSCCFQCERLSGELRMSHESTDLRYFPIDSLPDDLVIAHGIRIEDALKNASDPFVK